MRVASNDEDGRAGLRGSVQFKKDTHTHTHSQLHLPETMAPCELSGPSARTAVTRKLDLP